MIIAQHSRKSVLKLTSFGAARKISLRRVTYFIGRNQMETDAQKSKTRQDPVCGMLVEVNGAKFKSDYRGETYYFCSPACKKQFDANPENYLMRVL